MKKEELIALVASLQVVNLSNNKSALGVITEDSTTVITMTDHLKFSGHLTDNVMLDWLYKKSTDQLTVLRVNNATYELENILPNVMIDFKAAAEKFVNLATLALDRMAADYARSEMGES